VTDLLEDLHVVDLSRLVAGNMLTMLLADFGADVVKVESPRGGDTLRAWRVAGEELHWGVYGRNKRSVTLNLRAPVSRQVLLRLVAKADVVVESFRPGALEELGLGSETLHAHNPRLVICRVSGWGLSGAMASQPGFGTLVEAASGFASMNGYADRPPILPPIPLADMIAGIYGAFAVSSAAALAAKTGTGQVIDLSLLESIYSILGPTAATFARTGGQVPRNGSRSSYSNPRNIYTTSDGKWIALSGATQAATMAMFRAIGRPELADDPRFADNSARGRHADALDAVLAEYFARHPREVVLDQMRRAGVTVGPVNTIEEALESELFRTREVVVAGPPGGQTPSLPMHQPVPRLDVTPGRLRRPAPTLGEHNEEVVRPLLDEGDWGLFSKETDASVPFDEVPTK
jgi:crotonobetainyl-CoA:carnitine CoA-transferase CaiB-like acyl-CoA transferase